MALDSDYEDIPLPDYESIDEVPSSRHDEEQLYIEPNNTPRTQHRSVNHRNIPELGSDILFSRRNESHQDMRPDAVATDRSPEDVPVPTRRDRTRPSYAFLKKFMVVSSVAIVILVVTVGTLGTLLYLVQGSTQASAINENKIICDLEQLVGVRTVGSRGDRGLLQVYVDGRWSTVCANKFDELDVRVACRQLGYSKGLLQSIHYTDVHYPLVGIHSLDCDGTESKLQQCSHGGSTVHQCTALVAIACGAANDNPEKLRGIRLRNGTSTSGRVEVYVDNRWGTVCDDNFRTDSARIACRQLGLDGGTVVPAENVADGTLDIALDLQRDCDGSESSLEDCWHLGYWIHNCAHIEAVGVACT